MFQIVLWSNEWDKQLTKSGPIKNMSSKSVRGWYVPSRMSKKKVP